MELLLLRLILLLGRRHHLLLRRRLLLLLHTLALHRSPLRRRGRRGVPEEDGALVVRGGGDAVAHGHREGGRAGARCGAREGGARHGLRHGDVAGGVHGGESLLTELRGARGAAMQVLAAPSLVEEHRPQRLGHRRRGRHGGGLGRAVRHGGLLGRGQGAAVALPLCAVVELLHVPVVLLALDVQLEIELVQEVDLNFVQLLGRDAADLRPVLVRVVEVVEVLAREHDDP
mmetsp:Transcript_8366/g.20799  ORF Transcript_8366/g.20799 Transcript_8366/m.20799 type:complete len:230 (-) Transcript_8366:525-1214(-)